MPPIQPEAIKLIESVWTLVKQAPWSFLTLTSVIIGITWYVCKGFYSERIATLKERLEAYKEKLEGATPDEARAKMDKAERRVSEALHDPRKLTRQQLATMASALGGARGPITVTRVGSSAESVNVEAQMRTFLTQQGWQVTRGAHTMDSENRPSGGLMITSTARQPAAHETALISALKSAGIVNEFHQQPADIEPPLLRMVFADSPEPKRSAAGRQIYEPTSHRSETGQV